MIEIEHKVLAEKLRSYSQSRALPEGRKVGTEGHTKAKQFLADFLYDLQEKGMEPYIGDSFEIEYNRSHPTTDKPQDFTNLVGVIRGRDRSLPAMLVGAHYDSVISAPCVDDNATSVAKTMVLAEYYLEQVCLERDLVIAFFDAEEPPFFLGETMGSRRFCEDHCEGKSFAAVIISDLIGHDPNLRDMNISLPKAAVMAAGVAFSNVKKLVAVMGAETSSIFPEIVEQAANDTSVAKGIRVLATQNHYVGPVSDHAAFAKAGHPILFLSCGQGKYYHHEKDDMKWINFDKLAHITRYVSELIERIDESAGDKVHHPEDPFETEMRMLRKALGPMLPVLLKVLKIKPPESREELEALVEKF